MGKVALNTNLLDAILQASPIVQLTLLILISLSIVCWAVGYTKWLQFKKLKIADELFINKFSKATSLDRLYEELDDLGHSSISRVFRDAYVEMKKIAEAPHLTNRGGQHEKPLLSGMDNLERILRKSSDKEIGAMEAHLTILATTGSTGPFIGLFGTVWGIMGSFHKIGQTGNASLAVVAPGISEALIATAIGLAAAIPAVVLYNNFIAQIRKQEVELSNFSADFLNIVKRNFFTGE